MADSLAFTLDCHDPDRLAEFWAVALDYQQAGGIEQYRVLVHPDGAQPKMLLQRVPEAKTTKNRLHLDLHVTDPEADAERLVAAGATRVQRVDEFGIHWIVMLDPEGNEFCLVVS